MVARHLNYKGSESPRQSQPKSISVSSESRFGFVIREPRIPLYCYQFPWKFDGKADAINIFF
jgi:hypothetical protein